jgi:hypothetical protein
MKTKVWYVAKKDAEPIEVELFRIDAKEAMARFPDQYMMELPRTAAKADAADWDDLTIAQLKAEAEKRNLDLGDAKTKAEIVAVFKDRVKD